MPNKTKAENAAAAAAAAVPRKAHSIPEFCATYSISEGLYQSLCKRGLGPREIRVARRVLITVADAEEWACKQEEIASA